MTKKRITDEQLVLAARNAEQKRLKQIFNINLDNDKLSSKFAQLANNKPSLAPALLHHAKNLEHNFYKSPDAEIQKIFAKFIAKHPWLAELGYDTDKKLTDKKQICFIKNVNDLPDYISKQLKTAKQSKNKKHIFCAGGLVAEQASVYLTLLANSKLKISFINFARKNAARHYAAAQHHISLASPYHSISGQAGHNIMLKNLLVKLRSLRKKSFILEHSNLGKILIKIPKNIFLMTRFLKICLLNEYYWLKNILHISTSWQQPKLAALYAEKLAKFLHDSLKLPLISTNNTKFPALTLVKTGQDHAYFKNSHKLDKLGIKIRAVDSKSSKKLYPHSNNLLAFNHLQDFSYRFDNYLTYRNLVNLAGHNWLENFSLKEIYLDFSNNKAQIIGVKYFNHFNNTNYIEAVDALVFAPGYNTKVQYALPAKSNKLKYLLSKTPPFRATESLIPATGCSAILIFKKIDFVTTSFQGAHWSKIAELDDYLLIRATYGGHLNSKKYSSSSFLELINLSEEIFGDDFFGFVLSKSCVRSINACNNARINKIADNAVILSGLGGTGITQSHFLTLKALNELGFKPELKKLFASVPKIDKIMSPKFYQNFISTKQKISKFLLS